MQKRALFVALIFALASVALLTAYLRQFEQETSGGQRIQVLIAQQGIARGTLLTDALLSVREVPIAYLEGRAVKASERAKVLGVQLAQPLQAQDMLMWSDLAIAAEQRDLSSLIQPGNRAVTVRATSSDDTRVNALIHPGDYVDILATMALTNTRTESDARSSVVLLQKALVLAVGLATSNLGVGDSQNHQRDLVLTLSLNLQEAQLLTLATEKGKLSVALRSPDDQRVVEGLPDLPSTALMDTHARAEIQKVRRPALSSGPVRIQ
jgi:pilus assembly protein CpaB